MEPPRDASWALRLRAALESRWALPVLGLLAFGVSIAVQQFVYPDLSWNRDEPVYLWHVEVLRAGQLSTTDGGYPDLFQPWLSAARDGELFSQYTLGWPLALTLGAILGSPGLAVAGGASMTVVGTGLFVRELLRDRAVATLAAGLMLLSPIVAVQSGTHLNYLFTLGLGLFFLTAIWRGVRLDSRVLLVVAGALLGWIFLTRPFDAAIWGLVGVVPLVVSHRRRILALVGPGLWSTVGLLPIVAFTLAVNRRLTGTFTEFPITVADPLDQYGFGTRRLMPRFDEIEYGKRLAAEGAGRNTWWFPFFLVGAHLGLVVAAVGVWWNRRRPATWILVGLGVAFPLAYVPFFGTFISSLTARLSGPIYYIPAFVPLAVLVAMVLADLLRRRPNRMVLVGLALLAVTVPVTSSRLSVNHDLSAANQPWRESNESIEERALVVTAPGGYVLFANPFASNGADLDGDVLYAVDNGVEVMELVLEHQDRVAYLQRADRSTVELLPNERPQTPDVLLTPMEVLRGDVRFSGSVRAMPEQGASTVWWVEVDGRVAGAVTELTGDEDEIDVMVDSLGLSPGFHSIEFYVGRGADTSLAVDDPRERRTFYARMSDDGPEVLTPGTAAQTIRRPGDVVARWEESLSLPTLTVEPTTTP